jgi:hypothetical protein
VHLASLHALTHCHFSDSKPRGPESLGADISFIGASAVYGIPEHASSLALKATRYLPLGSSAPCCLFLPDAGSPPP